MEIPVFQLVPIASCPVSFGHHREEFDPILTPPFRYLYSLRRSPMSSLLQAEQVQLSSCEMSLQHFSSPSLDTLQELEVSSVLESPGLDTTPGDASLGLMRREESSPSTCWQCTS